MMFFFFELQGNMEELEEVRSKLRSVPDLPTLDAAIASEAATGAKPLLGKLVDAIVESPIPEVDIPGIFQLLLSPPLTEAHRVVLLECQQALCHMVAEHHVSEEPGRVSDYHARMTAIGHPAYLAILQKRKKLASWMKRQIAFQQAETMLASLGIEVPEKERIHSHEMRFRELKGIFTTDESPLTGDATQGNP